MRSFLLLFLCIDQLSSSTAFTSSGRITPGTFHILTNGKSFLSEKVKADDSSIEVFVSAITSLTDDLEEKDKMLTEAREEIKSLENTLKKQDDQAEQLKEFYPVFSAQMEERCAEVEKLKKKLKEANKLKDKIEAKNAEIGQLEEVIKDYEDQQSISLQVIDAKDLEIEELNNQIVKLGEDIKLMDKKQSSLISDHDEMKSTFLQKIDAKDKEIEKLNDRIENLGEEMKSTERKHYIENCTLKNDMQLEIETVKEELVKMQTSNNELELENNQYKEEEEKRSQYKVVTPLQSHQGINSNNGSSRNTWAPSDVV